MLFVTYSSLVRKPGGYDFRFVKITSTAAYVEVPLLGTRTAWCTSGSVAAAGGEVGGLAPVLVALLSLPSEAGAGVLPVALPSEAVTAVLTGVLTGSATPALGGCASTAPLSVRQELSVHPAPEGA